MKKRKEGALNTNKIWRQQGNTRNERRDQEDTDSDSDTKRQGRWRERGRRKMMQQ